MSPKMGGLALDFDFKFGGIEATVVKLNNTSVAGKISIDESRY